MGRSRASAGLWGQVGVWLGCPKGGTPWELRKHLPNREMLAQVVKRLNSRAGRRNRVHRGRELHCVLEAEQGELGFAHTQRGVCWSPVDSSSCRQPQLGALGAVTALRQAILGSSGADAGAEMGKILNHLSGGSWLQDMVVGAERAHAGHSAGYPTKLLQTSSSKQLLCSLS